MQCLTKVRFALPDSVTVEWDYRLREDPHSIELVAKSTLASNELSSVGSVETVHTVHPQYTCLVFTNIVFCVAIATYTFVAVSVGEGGR